MCSFVREAVGPGEEQAAHGRPPHLNQGPSHTCAALGVCHFCFSFFLHLFVSIFMSTLPWHPCAADSSCGDGYGGKTWVKGEGGIGSHDHSYSTHPIAVPMCSRRFWTYPYHHTHTYTHIQTLLLTHWT